MNFMANSYGMMWMSVGLSLLKCGNFSIIQAVMILLLCYLLGYYMEKKLISKLVWREKPFQTPPIVTCDF